MLIRHSPPGFSNYKKRVLATSRHLQSTSTTINPVIYLIIIVSLLLVAFVWLFSSFSAFSEGCRAKVIWTQWALGIYYPVEQIVDI